MLEDKELKQLQELLHEQEESTKVLVRRDLELSQANERLRTLDRMKTEFVSVAAHQLRTPLSVVKWAMKLLLDGDYGKITEEQKEILFKGYESNERMIKLIDDLLNLDRIESGQITYTMVPVQITDIVRNVVSELKPRADKHGLVLQFVEPEGSIPMVDADSDKLRAALQNLIDNAVKYTIPGGKVTIMVQKKDDYVEISVADTGIGVPDEQKRHLFSKFFRGTNATRLEPAGSGLGLFIARTIIERLKGTIRFESVEGEGTTFFVILPQSKSAISHLQSTHA